MMQSRHRVKSLVVELTYVEMEVQQATWREQLVMEEAGNKTPYKRTRAVGV